MSAPDEHRVTDRVKRLNDEEASTVGRSEAVIRGLFGRDSLYMMMWAIQLVLAALLTPVTTRLLGPSRFGMVASSVAVMQILVTIGGFSLQTAVQRAYAEPDGEYRARRLVAFAIIFSAGIFVLAYGSGELWCPMIGLGHFPPTVRYAVMWAALTAISNAALGLIRSRDQLKWFATVSLLQSAIAEALALCLVIFVARTSACYVFGQMLAQAATVAVALCVARPGLPSRGDLPILTSALRYSSALVPAALSAFVFDASDRLVIQGDLGSAAVGRYAVARNVGGFAIILLGTLNSVWLPRLFAVKDAVVQREVLAMSRDGIYALVVATILALTMASPVLLWIWVPPSYRPNSLLLVTALIACAALPMAGGQSATRLLLVRDRTFPVAIATIVVGVTNLGLNLLLVPLLGIDGSALVTLCCYGLQLAILRAASTGVLSLPKSPLRLIYLMVAGVAACLTSTAIPATGPGLALRMFFAVGACSMFCAQLVSMVAPQRLARVRHLLGWLPIQTATLVTGAGDAAS